jgi:hypothetical protein
VGWKPCGKGFGGGFILWYEERAILRKSATFRFQRRIKNG